jgi:predicted nucleotidyltransferase
MGLADVIRTALAPLAAQIDIAFIYGSVARQQDNAHSDVDVMIVSPTLGYGEVFGALEAAAVSLSRKVNPTLYTPVDWAKRIEQDSAFISRVLQQPKIWLVGDEEQLHAPGT